MKTPIRIYGLRAYLVSAYGLVPGRRIKYTEPGENGMTYLYEVVKVYQHCILLKDTLCGTMICPCFGKFLVMMRGIE